MVVRMTIKELKEKLNYLLEEGYVLESDHVAVSNRNCSGYIDSIAMPKVAFGRGEIGSPFVMVFTGEEDKGLKTIFSFSDEDLLKEDKEKC
jgi:hypothetical protein